MTLIEKEREYKKQMAFRLTNLAELQLRLDDANDTLRVIPLPGSGTLEIATERQIVIAEIRKLENMIQDEEKAIREVHELKISDSDLETFNRMMGA
ncbi:MAG: hypothetical protein LCH67_06185 [Bacteroidetes bacterium]|nr:hypothetical protein [Bacteroidota bacterium]